MTRKAFNDLEEFLETECDPYGINYDYTHADDVFEITLTKNNNEAIVLIKYENQNLYLVDEFEAVNKLTGIGGHSRDFWIEVSPELF